MIKQDVFDIRGAVKAEIEKQVKEYVGSVYEQGYENGYKQGKKESNNKLHKLYQELSDTYKTINSLERVGHWIKCNANYGTYLKCSECGLEYALKNTKNFCPNCGARMVDNNE